MVGVKVVVRVVVEWPGGVGLLVGGMVGVEAGGAETSTGEEVPVEGLGGGDVDEVSLILAVVDMDEVVLVEAVVDVEDGAVLVVVEAAVDEGEVVVDVPEVDCGEVVMVEVGEVVVVEVAGFVVEAVEWVV